MAAAIGSELPGQPPPYSVDDDVALLQPGDDDDTVPPSGRGKFSQPSVPYPQQQQPYGYAHPTPGYYGQPVQAMPSYYPAVPQQQTTVVVAGQVSQPAVIFVPTESFCGKMVLACFVLWCCNPLFGLIAFILAAHADGIKVDDREGAHRLGRASLWVSISGVIVAVIVSAIVTAVVVVNLKNQLQNLH